jgi:hypothetical protein
MLVRNALPLLTIAIVKFILPLARLEGIPLGMRRRFRLMMEGLRKPIGIPASRSSSRHKQNQKPRHNNHQPRKIPHRKPPSKQLRPLQLQFVSQFTKNFYIETKALPDEVTAQGRQSVTFR